MRKRVWFTEKRPHSGVLLLFVLTWVLTTYAVQGLLWEIILLGTAVLFSSTNRHRGFGRFDVIKWSLPFILLYTIAGALFAPASGHIFWQSPLLPLVGRLSLSSAGILGNLTRALRLWTLLLMVMSFGRMMKPEDIMHWFGHRFARISLTLFMVLNFIPQLLEERRRIAQYMQLRSRVGAKKQRMFQVSLIYRTLLMNALERSWALSESMFVRGYGGSRRTFYGTGRWQARDLAQGLLWLLVLLLAIGLLLDSTFALFGLTSIAWQISGVLSSAVAVATGLMGGRTSAEH